MSDSSIDRAVFSYLANCLGVFVQWPQCKSVNLWGDDSGGRLCGVRFEVRAMNPVDKTVFRIIVKKDDDWRVRIIQVSHHIRLDSVEADREMIVHAMNRFVELTGMREGWES